MATNAAMGAGEINLTAKPSTPVNLTNPLKEYTIPIQPASTAGNTSNNNNINNNYNNSSSSSCPAHEVHRLCSTSNKPPKIPTDPGSGPALTRRTTIKSKPKTRFGEPSVPIDSDALETFGTRRGEVEYNSPFTPPQVSSPIVNGSPASVEQRSAKGVSSRKGEVKEGPDEREVYTRVTAQLSARKHRRMTVKFLVQFVVFLLLLACLVASFTVENMERHVFYGLKVWKWFVLLMVIFSGMLITQWVVHLVVFLIEWKFMLKKNVVYFTHGLKTSVGVFLWFVVVLGSWVLLFKPDVDQSPKTQKFLDFVTWTIITLLIGSFLWLLKTTLLKILASSFHLNRFFDRIQDSVFHHYVLQILSGRPVMKSAKQISRTESVGDGAQPQVSFTEHVKSHKEKKMIDMGKLHRMKKEKVPSYTMQLLVNVVSNSGLSTMSGMLSEDVVEGGVELDDDEITSEEQAIATAYRIFRNIVQKDDRECIDKKDLLDRYIDKKDLLDFMMDEEVELLYPLFEPNETGQISIKAFSKWVVKVFKDRQQLQHALNDNKTAVKQLNKIITTILIVIVFIIWLLLTEIATTKILLFFSSQLLVAGFIFKNICKTIFEAIIFVFVMHPFDVGDRCLVDGTMMVVEEMNILTTVFLKIDKEKVYYPNFVLLTKPISNYYRSPDNQGDIVEFSIDFMTPLAKIGELKERIKKYLEANSHFWHPDHNVTVKEIENVNKIKMSLFVNHKMNFQDYPEKTRRRSELVLELKKIFEELHIKCHLLPQEVILNSMPSVPDLTRYSQYFMP